MMFARTEERTVETGASQIVFNDDNKRCNITFVDYVDGLAKERVAERDFTFDYLISKYPEEFAMVNEFFQKLCDDHNPRNPEVE